MRSGAPLPAEAFWDDLDRTFFHDPGVFEFTFVPEEIHHRDPGVRELAFLLRPTIRRSGRARAGATRTIPKRR